MPHSPLCNRLHEYRTKRALTQQALADLVGVTRQTIISIERGNYEPSVRLALKLARTLNVQVDELFYEPNI